MATPGDCSIRGLTIYTRQLQVEVGWNAMFQTAVDGDICDLVAQGLQERITQLCYSLVVGCQASARQPARFTQPDAEGGRQGTRTDPAFLAPAEA